MLKTKVMQWNLQLAPAVTPTADIDLEHAFGPALRMYRGLPVYYVDVRNFTEMMHVITHVSTNELALDIECNADFYEGSLCLLLC